MSQKRTLTAVRVRGPFRGSSGYDHHVREFARELYRQGLAIELSDLPEWGPSRLPDELREPWFESLNAPVAARVGLHFCMPPQVRPFPNTVTVNYTMFEATRIPVVWAAFNRQHDRVVVPTESSRDAWIAAGVPSERLRLCPLGIDPHRFAPEVEPLALCDTAGEPLSRYRVRFLNVSELGPRKNLVGLLRAWLLATTHSDDAVLIVKLSPFSADRRAQFQTDLDELQRSLRKPLSEAAPVHFLNEVFSDQQMPRLYAAATHYISLSHGEGWDQAMMEAAASSLRLIAPSHSAYLAYLDDTVARLVPSHEVPAAFADADGLQRLFMGANWWDPDENEAIAAIRAALNGYDQPAASARDRVRRQFTWEQATRRLISILAEPSTPSGRLWLWKGLPWNKRS